MLSPGLIELATPANTSAFFERLLAFDCMNVFKFFEKPSKSAALRVFEPSVSRLFISALAICDPFLSFIASLFIAVSSFPFLILSTLLLPSFSPAFTSLTILSAKSSFSAVFAPGLAAATLLSNALSSASASGLAPAFSVVSIVFLKPDGILLFSGAFLVDNTLPS